MTRRATCGLAALVAIVTSSIVETQAPPDSRQAAQRIVTRIQRADYEGDRTGLARLRAELLPFRDDRELAATVRYWQGFAAWRRALNGFNESADPNELDQDLRTAVRDFEAALEARPGYVDANAGLISCLQNLTFLHQTDQAAVQQLVPRFVTLLKESLAAAPDNPRLLWVYGVSQWYTPSGSAPEDIDKRQASALDTYQRGLALARAAQGRPVDPLEPGWGEPELLMNLAWANLNRRVPDVRAAEAHATRALAIVPYWHYVRDILMPQIRKASNQRADKPAPAAAAVTSVALRVHREDAMAAFYAEAFGARFRVVDTRGVRSRFADLPNLTLKLVPIRQRSNFEEFPVHQLGFDVPDVGRVIEIALRHGGRVQDPPVRDDGRIRAAVRDPDGNTIEISGPR